MDNAGVEGLPPVDPIPADGESGIMSGTAQLLVAAHRKINALERENAVLRDAVKRDGRDQEDDRAGRLESELVGLRSQIDQERKAQIAELKAEVAAQHERTLEELTELRTALESERAGQRERDDRVAEALQALADPVAVPVRRGRDEAAPLSTGLLPGYVASAYREVSDLLERAEERHELSGEIEALRLKELAARQACEVLYQLVDDPVFYDELRTLAELAEEHGDEIDTLLAEDERFEDFRTKQLELLVIAGVPRPEAGRLIDDCRAYYSQGDRKVLQQPAVTRRNLRRLRNATCDDATGRLQRNLKRAEARAEVLPFVANGLGGAALVALGVPMEAIGGKVFAGAVGAIGTAGIQAATQQIGKRR